MTALVAGLAASQGLLWAQETPPPPPPPGAGEGPEAEAVVSNVIAETVTAVLQEGIQGEGMENAATNNHAQALTNVSRSEQRPSQTERAREERSRNGDDRSYRRSSDRGDYRRTSSDSSSRGSGSDRPGTPAPGGSATSSGRLDFSAFAMIAERNIFDPNRRGARSVAPRERPKVIETFGLVGVMSYDKGTFAFFDGSSSSYRKALKQHDSIAGYTVTGITPSAVQLSAGTNQVELKVGSQLRREDAGAWTVSRQAESFAASSYSSGGTSSAGSSAQPTTSSSSSGGESDVLRRLRERRERE